MQKALPPRCRSRDQEGAGSIPDPWEGSFPPGRPGPSLARAGAVIIATEYHWVRFVIQIGDDVLVL